MAKRVLAAYRVLYCVTTGTAYTMPMARGERRQPGKVVSLTGRMADPQMRECGACMGMGEVEILDERGSRATFTCSECSGTGVAR